MTSEAKSFEENIKDLEKISQELENGDLDLDKLITKFEEGMKISKLCNTMLEEVENKITMIIKDDKGNIEENIYKKED